MVERYTLAAIGEVVVDAAVLEYWLAVLVAAAEGKDDNRARDLAMKPGTLKAFRELAKRRSDLDRLYRDANAVFGDRHVLAHSVNLIVDDANLEPGYSIWNPRHDAEARITRQEILEHA